MKIDALVSQAAALGMESLALTDRGTLSGAIEFYKACKNTDIRPIIGLEIDAGLGLSSGVVKVATLTLLAANAEGWNNLCILSSQIQCSEHSATVTEDDLKAASYWPVKEHYRQWGAAPLVTLLQVTN